MNAIVKYSPSDIARMAEVAIAAKIVPPSLNTPEKVQLAMLYGQECGLKPFASLRSVKIVNGIPSLYGDGLLCLVLDSGLLEDIKEYYEGEGDQLTAVCEVTRKGLSMHRRTFSVSDAKVAGLWGKPGPWKTNPARMQQWRARGFALRDRFADVLDGLISAEEALDYPPEAQPDPQPEPYRVVETPPEIVAQNKALAALFELAAIPCPNGELPALNQLVEEQKNNLVKALNGLLPPRTMLTNPNQLIAFFASLSVEQAQELDLRATAALQTDPIPQ